MAIRTVVTRGYSTGSFTSSIALVVVRGYKFVVADGGTRRQRQIKSLIKSRRRRGRRH